MNHNLVWNLGRIQICRFRSLPHPAFKMTSMLIRIFLMKRKDMSFHFWVNNFRTKKLENGHSSALTLTPGPSSDLRAHMWDSRHQGNSVKLWGACQLRMVQSFNREKFLLTFFLQKINDKSPFFNAVDSLDKSGTRAGLHNQCKETSTCPSWCKL